MTVAKFSSFWASVSLYPFLKNLFGIRETNKKSTDVIPKAQSTEDKIELDLVKI